MQCLLDFPTELLVTIARLLKPLPPVYCAYCSCSHVSGASESSYRPLISLARTCRRLRDISRAELWHQVLFDSNWTSLIYVSVTSPVLAACVDVVVFNKPFDSHLRSESFALQGRRLFKDLDEHHPAAFLAAKEKLELLTRRQVNLHVLKDIRQYLTVFILSLFPRASRFIFDGVRLPTLRLPPKSLPSLIELSFRHEVGDWGRTNKGTRHLIQAAPSLISLCVTQPHGSISHLQHTNLETLRLHNVELNYWQFQDVIEGFPNLKRLELVPDRDGWDDGPLMSRRISQILISKCSKIQQLVLDFSSLEIASSDMRAAPCNLSQLTKLKSIRLCGFVFVKDIRKYGIERNLADQLPSSIQNLEVLAPRGKGYVEAILELVDVLADKFPNLTSLTLEDSSLDSAAAAAAAQHQAKVRIESICKSLGVALRYHNSTELQCLSIQRNPF